MALSNYIDIAVLILLTASGLLFRAGPAAWYVSLLTGFVGISVAVLSVAGAITYFTEKQSDRLQGKRRLPALIRRGIAETTLAAWVAACFLAWPLARMRVGLPTGLTWSLDAAGGPLLLVVQNIAAVLVLDAWLYWKHRLLHTRLLFPFHRAHHAARDPTPLAAFAVGPVEAVLTFWPIVFLAMPEAPHYAPVYYGLVVGFILQNFYLHCGISVGILEKLLTPFMANSSVFHNKHHANARVNFGEALTLWDYLCKTQAKPKDLILE